MRKLCLTKFLHQEIRLNDGILRSGCNLEFDITFGVFGVD